MLPMEFDRQILGSLPLPGDDQVKLVLQVLNGVLVRRVLPYFKSKRGTDPLLVAQVGERLLTVRQEDEAGRMRTVSLVNVTLGRWSIHIHERIFDYLAFVIPGDPDSRLGKVPSKNARCWPSLSS